MRPAQIAREINRAQKGSAFTGGFNEARANCAGNSTGCQPRGEMTTGFNEARANCAGN